MLPDSEHCCGCGACSAVCPCGAIRMAPDQEGFLQPTIDTSRCISCKRCETSCPVLNPKDSRLPLAVFAAKARERKMRLASSSGGAFSLLAKETFRRDGIVYGATMQNGEYPIAHVGIKDEEQLFLLQGSKYAQSVIGDCYKNVVRDLKQGRHVLFSGTPCQIAGLNAFLGGMAKSDYLLRVEVFCHAVPSPVVFRNYLDDVENRNHAMVRNVKFRDKRTGWVHYSSSIEFGNGQIISKNHTKNPYMQLFLSDIANRRSCYRCPFRELRSGADISIGDFWGLWNSHPEFCDKLGVSAVLLNSRKGLAYWSAVENVESISATYDEVRAGNHSLFQSPEVDNRRTIFYEKLNRGVPFTRIIRFMLVTPFLVRLFRYAKRRLVPSR